MKITLKVTVICGPRTETELYVEKGSVNRKTMRIKGGAEFTEDELANYIDAAIIEFLELKRGLV